MSWNEATGGAMWAAQDLADLAAAVERLEHPGFVARLSDLVGMPIEAALRALPAGAGAIVTRAVHASMRSALDLAVRTMDPGRRRRPRFGGHALAAGLAGGVGGAFGLPALALELPVTTTIILRSIAEIARSEGEDLTDPVSRLACLEVFAMGGATREDDAAESGYFAVRTALAQAVSEATKYVASKAVVEDGAPVLVRLLAQIAARFKAVVGEKILAQGVPIVGAVGGAAVNVMFIDHFQDMARGHFTVRRLERRYGRDEVRRRYEELARSG